MKITLYTITGCIFSKQEKEYLSSHQLTFEEKNLEINREFLTEMLAVSNNFAGTPVTRIEKDDGQIAVLKGFTKEEFDKLFGFTQESVKPVEAVPTPAAVPAPPVEPPAPAAPPAPSTSQAPAPDPLAGVLSNLEQQVNAVPTPPPPPAAVSTAAGAAPAGAMPAIPDPQL
jgi:glutaredoxin